MRGPVRRNLWNDVKILAIGVFILAIGVARRFFRDPNTG